MSERYYTSLSIGGTLKFEDLEEFTSIVGNLQGVTLPEDWLEAGEEFPDGLDIEEQECPASGADELLEFCQERGLSYTFDQDGGGEYDREFRWWTPGMPQRGASLTNDGYPFFPLERLKKSLAAGLTLADVVAKLEEDSAANFTMPAFVVEDAPITEEVTA